METELRRAVNALCDDAVQLTAAAYQAEEPLTHAGPGDAAITVSSLPAPAVSMQGVHGASRAEGTAELRAPQ